MYLPAIANASLAVKLVGRPSAISPSYATFLIGLIPTPDAPQPDTRQLRRDGVTLVDWSGARVAWGWGVVLGACPGFSLCCGALHRSLAATVLQQLSAPQQLSTTAAC